MEDQVLADAVKAAAPLLPRSPEERAAYTAEGVLAAWARSYAVDLGWPVFPLVPGGKVPAVERGFYAATTDVAQVERWWLDMPYANIGTPTGQLFDVIDIDAPDGWATWAAAEDAWRADGITMPPYLAISVTGSGGRHLLIPPQRQGNGASLGAGLDYRGIGGYIVLPPSQLAHGGVYEWLEAPKRV